MSVEQNRALMSMARAVPASLEQLLGCWGWGEAKVAAHGARLLAVLRPHAAALLDAKARRARRASDADADADDADADADADDADADDDHNDNDDNTDATTITTTTTTTITSDGWPSGAYVLFTEAKPTNVASQGWAHWHTCWFYLSQTHNSGQVGGANRNRNPII